MSVTVVYVYPLGGAGNAKDLANRFVGSYIQYPAGEDHRVVVACNGALVDQETRSMFELFPSCSFMEHDNSGYDIGAFQRAAREYPCDLMVFFGNSAYIRGANWLARMVEAFRKHGNILYGCMENSGHMAVGVYPHIRTTGFWMKPELLNAYPHKVIAPHQRYPFEHGASCLTSWCLKYSNALVVGWRGEYGIEQWGRFPEGFHRGSQDELLTGDKNSAPPYYHYM